jgi:hypothetical protein
MTLRHITSANRIKDLLLQSSDINTIEGLLTDIIHYCNVEDMHFYELLKQAEWHVKQEILKDEAESDEASDKV